MRLPAIFQPWFALVLGLLKGAVIGGALGLAALKLGVGGGAAAV